MSLIVLSLRAENNSIIEPLKTNVPQSPKMERRGAIEFKKAREACLKEKVELKGKKLNDCIVDYQRKEAN